MVELKLNKTYTPIDAESKFDQKQFGEAQGTVKGLENILSALDKDPNDFQAVNLAGDLLMGNRSFYVNQDQPAMMAKYSGNLALKEGNQNLINYTVKNSKDIYSTLNDEEKSHVLMSSDMKTFEKPTEEELSEGNHQYNQFANSVNLSKKLNEISESDTTESRAGKIAFVAQQSQYSRQWVQEMTRAFSSNDTYINSLFQEYAVELTEEIAKSTLDKEGKPDDSKIEKFATTNFKLHTKAEQKDALYFGALKDAGYSAYLRNAA